MPLQATHRRSQLLNSPNHTADWFILGGNQLRVYDSTDTDYLQISHDGTDAFIDISNTGGKVVLRATDAGSTVRTILTGDPDAVTTLTGDTNLELQVAAGETALLAVANAATTLYFDNIARLAAQAFGDVWFKSDTSTDTEKRRILFLHQDNTLRGLLGHDGDDVLAFQNLIHGGNLQLTAEDAGGVERVIMTGDPDARTTVVGDTELFLNSPALGFYSTTPIALQTGVAVTAAGIHAALVSLGLITA